MANKVRYKRIASPNACRFCRMLADRGAVYHENSKAFRSHDHCSCTAEPVFSKDLKIEQRGQGTTRGPLEFPIRSVESFLTTQDDAMAVGHILKGLPGEKAFLSSTEATLRFDIKVRSDLKAKIVKNLTSELVKDPKFAETFADAGITLGGPSLKKAIVLNPALVETEAREWTDLHIRNWALSSNKGVVAETLQRAAVEEFGLIDAAPSFVEASAFDVPGALEGMWAAEGASNKLFLRKMYEATQAEFKRQGITSVRLTRGMAFVNEPPVAYKTLAGAQMDVSLRPISSFSARGQTAKWFGRGSGYGAVMTTDVPVERILSTARTGFGALHEAEYTVLGGGKVSATVHAPFTFRVSSLSDKGEFLKLLEADTLASQKSQKIAAMIP